MARYTGPVCRLCRREDMKLFLKGDRCYTDKCAYERRAYPPGQHGQGRKKRTDFGEQLREKQKVRRMYGILEKQFRGYYVKASRMKGVTGENLLMLLERRLDNVVYRCGFAVTRTQARQLVSHKHILVNGKPVNIPSYEVNVGDVIAVKEKSRELAPVQNALGMWKALGRKSWIDFNEEKVEATFKAIPERDDLDDVTIREQLIVELYSK